jgi:mono/diheme cytochrome c family protein
MYKHSKPWGAIGILMLVGNMAMAADGGPPEPQATANELRIGENIFRERCVICHGINADGRSDLARIMRPPPANLRASQLTFEQRTQIVSKGGASVGRSSNMPIWKDELNPEDLHAVIAYVGTLRVLEQTPP